jgi:glutamate 5-kinase
MRKKRWVIKAGSQMVCQGGPILVRAWMQQVARLKDHNQEIIWVTSGAIATAKERQLSPKRGVADGALKKLLKNKKPLALPQKQALSAIGQPLIMDTYNAALNASGLQGAQVLLTAEDIANKHRRQNLQNTLNQLLAWNAVPVINENDAVSTDEIQFGDNDNLSALIAQLMGADYLVILTDVDGLYDRNPFTKTPFAKTKSRVNQQLPPPRLIKEVPSITPKILSMAPLGEKGSKGTGGMRSKLLAAKTALKKNPYLSSAPPIITWLVKGDRPLILEDIFYNRATGTRIRAARNK